MIMEKKLYPLKFIPVPSRRPWGGSALVNELGKHFVEVDEEGNESIYITFLKGQNHRNGDRLVITKGCYKKTT